MVERFIAPVLKTGMSKGIGGSNPPPSSIVSDILTTYSQIAQLAEQRTVNPRVVGSSPTLGAMSNEYEATIRDMQKSISDYELQVRTWMKTAEKYSIEAALIKFERDTYKSILLELEKAIKDAGVVPKYHHHVMKKHRDEWPTLWKALDRMLSVLNQSGIV